MLDFLAYAVGDNSYTDQQIQAKKPKRELQPLEEESLPSSLSVYENTRMAMEEKIVLINYGFCSFSFKGFRNITNSVTLFPEVTCTCPATRDCYHIVAYKMWIGLTDMPSKKETVQLSEGMFGKKAKRAELGKGKP